ncbi:DUF1236 domain-containing protein [Devosia sp. ZB163]|uniref:DUF1236 domain-containing protein n=1 Tax=Devosia sp. ZB163 TaxID=3025938 RepID=UPI003FCDD96B
MQCTPRAAGSDPDRHNGAQGRAGHLDFAVDVGVVVPSTVVLQPLPASIITLVPRWAGFLFFVLADGRIVVVEPAGLKVVAVVTA